MAFWLRPLPSRGLTLLRAVTMLLLLLAICGLSVNLPSRSGCVVVVADRSLSMPAGSQAQQVEAAELVVPFDGPRAMNWRSSPSGSEPRSNSRPADAFQRICQRRRQRGLEPGRRRRSSGVADPARKPRPHPGPLRRLCDGRRRGRRGRAGGQFGIAIDYRAMQRSGAGDLAIERINAPPRSRPRKPS